MSHTDPSEHESCSAVGCGGQVYNSSDIPVMVFGTYKDGTETSCNAEGLDGCTRLSDGSWAKRAWRELPAHTSSIDSGMYDVVFVRPVDGYPLDGHGPNWEYKLIDTQVASITTDTEGNHGVGTAPKAGISFLDSFLIGITGYGKQAGWHECKDDPDCTRPYDHD